MKQGAPARSTYFFDGGCRPNPGPMHAAVVSRGQAHFREFDRSGDNNEAEWLALLFAMELAQRDGTTNVLLIGDAALVVNQASGRQPCRSAHLRPYLEAFAQAASHFVTFRVRHVPRARNLAGIALARRDEPGRPAC